MRSSNLPKNEAGPIIAMLTNRNRPRFLLGVIALATALAVQPGDLGSVDTVRRLQVTHWIWTSAPQVAPGEFPGFGVPGRNGRIYAWYGIGQSLLMLPPDVVATFLINKIAALRGKDQLRGLIVSYTISPLICVLAVFAALRFLESFGFTTREAIAGTLGLLFATTFLHYTQNMMENNLLVLLMLIGVRLQYQWMQTGSKRSLAAGSIVLGAGILVRLTVTLDCIAIGIFVAMTLWLSGSGARHSWPTQWTRKLVDYIKVCTPVYLVYILLDRAYHYYRFGQCCTNYIQLYGQQSRLLDPSLPANFPYTVPFWQGFWGPLISPEKSVLLFDPLVIIAAGMALLAWNRLAPHIKAFLAAMSILLVTYMAFHARLFFWGGDVAWGDRYLTTPVQLLALLAIPLLLRHGPGLGKNFRRSAAAIVSISVIVQIESLLMPAWVEFKQASILGHPVFVIGRRFLNVAAFTAGKLWGWQIESSAALASARTTSLYFYPFVLAHDARHVPQWASTVSILLWALLLGMIVALLFRLQAVLSNHRTSGLEPNSLVRGFSPVNSHSPEVIT